MESSNHRDEIVSQFTRQSQLFADNKAHSEARSFEVFRELGQFTGSERVLDSGCGPGLVSRYLARHVREVVGVDLTPAMVELAERTARDEGVANVCFRTGNMVELPFAEGEFDAVVSRYAFHHLEHPAAAFAELVRVTRPGGRIVVVDATPEAEKREAYDRFERLRDPSHTSALTREEMAGLGESLGLGKPQVVAFELPMRARELVNSSFPEGVSREGLADLLKADVGRDGLGFRAREEDGELVVSFPISGMGWIR